MKKTVLLALIITLAIPPLTASAQGSAFDLSSSKNFVDTSLKTVGASAATCLTRDLADGLIKKVQDNIEKKIASKLVNAAGRAIGVGELAPQEVNDIETRRAVSNLLGKLTSKENCWDGIASNLGQIALQQITSQTIAWVNTGLDGNPTYVRDINSLLQSIRHKQLSSILPEIQTSNPIFGNAIRGVLTKQLTGKDISFNALLMKENPEAIKYADFMDDFTKEGWSGLLNSSYNPLGSLFSAVNNISGQLGTEEQNTREEISRNSGFLDIKECVEESSTGTCLRYATTHPGSLIASQIARIYESPINQVEQIDEINEVIYKFFYNFLDKTFKKDANGKSGLFYAEFDKSLVGLGGTHLGSNVIFDANGKAILANGSDLALTKGFKNIDISRPQELREAIETQIDFIAATKDILVIAADVRAELAQLDYCMPGPNPEWATYSDEGNFQDNFLSMAEETKKWWEMPKNEWMTLSGAKIKRSEAWSKTNTARTTAFITNFPVVDRVTKTTFEVNLENLTRSILQPSIQIKWPAPKEEGFDLYETAYANFVPQGMLVAPLERLSPVSGQNFGGKRGGGTGGYMAFLFLEFNNIKKLFENKVSKTAAVFNEIGSISMPLMASKPIIPFYFEHSHKNEDTFVLWLAEIGDELIKELTETYSKEAIGEAFGSTGSTQLDKILNKGTAISAYRETEGLMSYMESYDEIVPLYRTYITDTESLISELEGIHYQARTIVKAAKARYIQQRAAVGDPVDMACINAAYVINEAPYAKADRFERATLDTNQKIKQVNSARNFFEEVALIKPEVERREPENPRNTSIDNSKYNDRSNEVDNGDSTNPTRGRTN